MMIRAIFTTFSLSVLCGLTSAQVQGGDSSFDKLFDMFVMEKYEDCAYKAENLSMNDKYRRNPEPYLYLSMCYYEIYSNIDDYDEELYKDALKLSLKYAYKARSKSDYQVKKEIRSADESIYAQNHDFFMDLKKLGIQEAKSWLVEDNWRKAASQLKAVVKFVPEDYSIQMMKGLCEIQARNVGQGAIDVKTAVANMNKAVADGNIKPDPISDHVGVDAFIKYTDWLVEQQMADSAKITIELASQVYKGNDDIRNQHSKLH